MNYYYLEVWYTTKKFEELFFRTCAESPERALEIAIKHDIKGGKNARRMMSRIHHRTIRQVNLEDSLQIALIARRRNGIGGNIFYEENGELKVEKR